MFSSYAVFVRMIIDVSMYETTSSKIVNKSYWSFLLRTVVIMLTKSEIEKSELKFAVPIVKICLK